ncbi:hypothetical protein LOTGIDRAFT_238729 [Lottia gigantea]|uniref:Uncharacterized protein n=1 Tax=Lottia gigantea TaxID=225164 RepID=V4AXF2_LOTGI|nr:hypothetical protein LOTGIDRAFT_238729 [Lottia gigantea]ESO99725.1 hypothetical protein LOTGIDRAFT_238729 [Lottia gigantea]
MLECEKLIIAVELAGWLNEANLALQGVIQCYGLLAPLLYHRIPSQSVIKILQRSHCVLQEIPAGLILKRQGHIADSLHHMTACITYQMARALRTWGQKTLANNINEAGRKLLSIEGLDKDKQQQDAGDKAVEPSESMILDTNVDPGMMTLQALKRKRKGRNGPITSKDDMDGTVNEELKALEAHILRMTKTSQNEMELSGNEDPNILHAYIAFLPAKMAYKEVQKFKRRARYLEFIVQVAQKGLVEGLSEQVIDWCEDCVSWLNKRNEQIIGNRAFMSKQPGAITVSGDDPKKFAAAMVEYTKDKDTGHNKGNKPPAAKASTTHITPKPRRKRYRPFNNYSHMPDTARHAQEEKEAKAVETLGLYFSDMYRTAVKKKRLRKINTEELPWKSQMKIVLGLSCFQSFLQKLEKREKLMGTASSNMYKTSYLDPEWFTFETAGTLVVGWDGGPARQPSRPDILEQDDGHQPLDLAMAGEKRQSTAIEIAAAAVIVGSVAPAQRGGLVQQSQEFDDTPRTYRSDISTIQETVPLRSLRNKEDDISLFTTQATIQALNKTFTYLKQSLILAHRGQHWTLLQNACNSLWNCAHTALLRASTTNQGPVETGLFTVETLRGLVWKPFYQSVDCLLDMMYKLQINLDQQATKAKSKSKVLGEYFENWYGDVKKEKGGTSLKYEQPLDDNSVVDVLWIRRYILRVIEMLYYEQKWEKLVDIALRFNALSNYRYAEQVIPLMVQAQRKLEVIVNQAGGPKPPQKHFQMVLKQLDGVLSAKDYLQCQLKIQVDRRDLKPVEPGAHIDPLGHNVYSEKDAKKLICVPLDYDYSLDTLRQVLDQSRYAARALRHSRKMLVLYLAGQQNNNEDPMMPKSQSKVDFLPNTAHPEPTVPLDLMKEEFQSTDDVQTAPIPRSQLTSVIESYQKTIDSLMAKNQRGLGAQAMFELGNLYYHTNNIRSTFKWWCEGLDVILNLTDALHTWKSVLADNEDISRELLSRCGLWGCLLGGIITSNIAQYILTSDFGLRLECCFLSGYFFKALFRASLPHPTSDRDYALYDVGEGCEVTSLVPGIDLLSDRFRADGRQVVAALRWVTEELSRGRHNLFVLPLLTMNQYFTTFVCRDLQRSVDCRILKIRVLTDLRFFTEAFTVLRRLLHGERLPQIGDSGFRHVESKMGILQFNTSKPIMETNNLKVLETVIDKRLTSNLATLYGPHLTCQLLLVQSHLLITVADTLPVIPALADAVVPSQAQLENQFIVIKARAANTLSHVGMGTRAPRLVSATSQNIGSEDIRDQEVVDDEMYCFNRRFTECKKTLTLEIIKATLLNTAEQMVTTLSDNLTDNNQHHKNGSEELTAAELELVILCKLQQSAISRQKHHAPLAARIAFSTLKLLQHSDLFKSKKEVKIKPRKMSRIYEERPSSLKGHGNKKNAPMPDIKLNKPNNSQFEYYDFQSRSRLDIRLWLKCRLELVQCLMMELKGMGDIRGSENKFVSEIGDCRQYCVEGVGESDMIGDVELQAEFFLQGAYLNIMEGKNIDHTISLLKESKDNLLKCVRRSDKGEELLIQCLMLMTDLCLLSNVGEKKDDTQYLENYIEIHNLTLNQLEKLGERIERYRNEKDKQFSTPVTPMNNVYVPHLLFLTQLKLRIGHSLAQNAAIRSSKGLSDTEAVYLWLDSMGVLVSALDISRFSINRDSSLETEILYDLGRVQKMLVFLDKFPARRAANTLLDAIKISYGTDHNLSLIRQAYLEIGQIYLYSSSLPLNKEGTGDAIGDSGDESNVSTPAPPSSKPPSSSQSKRKWKGKKERSKSKQSKDEDYIGDSEKEKRAAWLAMRCAAATGQALRARLLLKGNPEVTQKLPERAVKEIPDFLALDLMGSYVLGQKRKVFKSEIEEELSTLKEADEVRHYDTYDEQIMKCKVAAKDVSWIQVLGYQSILHRLVSTKTMTSFSVPTVESQTTLGSGTVGSEFDLGFISHTNSCSAANNIIKYMLCSGPWIARLNNLHYYLSTNLTSYAAECCAAYPPAGLNLPVPQTPSEAAPTQKSFSSGLSSEMDHESILSGSFDINLMAPPGFKKDSYKPSDKGVVSPEDNEICIQWLSMLSQRGEISLADKQKKEKEKEPVVASTSQTKNKKVTRIKALSPKVQRDEQLEGLLYQCLDDCATLLNSQTDQDSMEIPFEVTKPNLKNLEAMFDPGLGLNLRNGDLLTWLLKLFPTTNQ